MPCDHPQASCDTFKRNVSAESDELVFFFFSLSHVATGSDLKAPPRWQLDGGHFTSVSAGSLDGSSLSA